MTLHEPTWDEARAAAWSVARERPSADIALSDALHRTLAGPLIAAIGVPAFDTAMMDGWAVSGPGPWHVAGQVLAGSIPEPLPVGHAIGIATGAPVPTGATAVLRREWGAVAADVLSTTHAVAHGDDIRIAGDEAHAGDVVLPAGVRVTPPVIGLAALVGCDVLRVYETVRVQVLVCGDEIVQTGIPPHGRVRDALGVQIKHWTAEFGTSALPATYVADTLDAHVQALLASTADIVFTTGGTARGPVDHMHAALEAVGARLIIDEVRVRPGHPMLLAQLPDGRFVVGLPGNPLAAVVGYITLGEPLLRAMHGLPVRESRRAITTQSIAAPSADRRLIPGITTDAGVAPTQYWGSAMLRGIAGSDCLIVTEPGGAEAGTPVGVLPLPW